MAGEVAETPVSIERVMRQIESDVRRDRRSRLLARGGAGEYADEATFTAVERVLRRAVEDRDHDVLLLPELVPSDQPWQLDTRLRFASHRPLLGGAIVAIKRRVLLPLTRWLYEYSLENFRRQQRLNRILFACLEELALENVKLRQDLQHLIDDRSR